MSDPYKSQSPEALKARLGDQPIQPEIVRTMNEIAQILDFAFNGQAKGKDRQWGFVLQVFPFGDRSGRCNYISNGADRRDIVVLMKEQIKRFEGQPDITGRA